MKKLFILSIICLFALTISGQTGENQITLQKGTYYVNWAGRTSDTVGTGNDEWVKPIFLDPNTACSFYYDFEVKVKEYAAATGTTNVILNGKKNSGDAWTAITTVLYSGTGTDTTIHFSQDSTKLFWNYYSIELDHASGVHKVYPDYIKAQFKIQ